MERTVNALKIWKHAYLDLSISERTKIDLQSKLQKAKVPFLKKFLPGGDSEYSLFPPGDQGVWGGRHIRGQRKIPLGHTVTMITLRIGHIAFLRWTIVIFTVARISINLNFNAFNRYSGCPKKMLLSGFVSSVRSSNSHPDLLLIHPTTTSTHFFRSHRSSTLDFHFLSQ